MMKTMKKKYIAPSIVAHQVLPMMMIAASDSVSSEMLNDVSFGGVDTGGTIIPAAREFDGLLEQIQIMDIPTE